MFSCPVTAAMMLTRTPWSRKKYTGGRTHRSNAWSSSMHLERQCGPHKWHYRVNEIHTRRRSHGYQKMIVLRNVREEDRKHFWAEHQLHKKHVKSDHLGQALNTNWEDWRCLRHESSRLILIQIWLEKTYADWDMNGQDSRWLRHELWRLILIQTWLELTKADRLIFRQHRFSKIRHNDTWVQHSQCCLAEIHTTPIFTDTAVLQV